MKRRYSVVIKKFAVLEEIAGAWQPADYRAMLDAMEYGDTTALSDSEAEEMCLLSLQDLDPEEAAAVVLRHRLANRLSSGQIQNIANEMLDEKMWEDYADMSLHEQMFAVGSLLHKAFPAETPEPDAVRVALEVSALKGELELPLSESFLVRLLAAGMEDRATLHRMFADQLQGKSFPEADTIVWIVETKALSETTAEIAVISSGYWLDALRDTRSYECTAHPDGAIKSEGDLGS